MAYNGFAIDRYLDADAVNAQLDKLIKSPIYGVLPDALAEYERDYFEKKCSRSKEEISVAREIKATPHPMETIAIRNMIIVMF